MNKSKRHLASLAPFSAFDSLPQTDLEYLAKLLKIDLIKDSPTLNYARIRGAARNHRQRIYILTKTTSSVIKS